MGYCFRWNRTKLWLQLKFITDYIFTYDYKSSTLAAHESQVSPYNLRVERSRSWGIGYCRWFRAINVFHLWNFIHASQFVNDLPYWFWGEMGKIMTWWPVHKWLLVCYPLIIMKLYIPSHLLPLSVLLILGSRGQGIGLLVIENGLRTIKLTPCVKDIPCIFKVLKGFLWFFFASLTSPLLVRNWTVIWVFKERLIFLLHSKHSSHITRI